MRTQFKTYKKISFAEKLASQSLKKCLVQSASAQNLLAFMKNISLLQTNKGHLFVHYNEKLTDN